MAGEEEGKKVKVVAVLVEEVKKAMVEEKRG